MEPTSKSVTDKKQSNSRPRGRRLIADVKQSVVTRFLFSPAMPEIDDLRGDYQIPAFGVTGILIEDLYRRVTEIERRGPAQAATSTGRPFLVGARRTA